MLAAVAHLAKSGQPLHHLTIATDPVQSCTLGIKLAKRTGKTKLIHLSVICSLQSSLCLGVPAASGLTSGLPTPVLRTQGQAHTHTQTSTQTPPCHPGWMRDSRLGRHGTASDQWRGTLGAARS